MPSTDEYLLLGFIAARIAAIPAKLARTAVQAALLLARSLAPATREC